MKEKKPTKSSKQQVEPAENVEQAKQVKQAENVKTTEAAKQTENVEQTKQTKQTKQAENVKAAEDVKQTGHGNSCHHTHMAHMAHMAHAHIEGHHAHGAHMGAYHSRHRGMPAGKYGIAHEAYPLLSFLSLATLTFALLNCEIVALISLLAFFFTLHFFRDPERVIPQDKNIAVSPADGKVIRIEEREDPISGEKRICMSIFMNVFSVHVNRAPVKGVISNIKYFSGEFYNADWDKASTDNERCAYQMKDEDDNLWTFVQISGLIARRIVCKVEEGTVLSRGKRFGMIRFGSRVDVYLPANYEHAVGIGAEVFAGESILARVINKV